MNIDPLQAEEIQLFRNRAIVIGIIIALLFSLLASRLWFLQVLNGSRYAEFAKGNRIRLIPQAAPRGVLYDRNGVALAYNRPAYQLQLIREDTPDLELTLRNLSESLKIPYASLRKKVEEKQNQARFKPIILDEDLDHKRALLVETYQEDFPGVSVVVQSRRYYPNNKIASHILGYVGIRDEKQEENMPANKRTSGMFVGKSGVELVKNETLIGTDGGKQIEVDHVGRELKILNRPVNPIPGEDAYLSIDIEMQQLVDDTMKGKSGAVIVMDLKSGELLAMGSFPGFNPNLFAAGISRRNWNRMINNPDNPLENKVIQGQYPPGSAFKVITAYAGLDQKVINEHSTYTCNGFYYIKGRQTPFKCWRWKLGGHGTVNLKDAIKGSCNVYFYHVAQELGIEKLHDYATKFKLGNTIGLRLPHEKEGIIPNEEWKLRVHGERWYAGETPPIGIGQGYLLVTPLQMMNVVNIIANNGIWIPPKLILDQENGPQPQSLEFNPNYLALIREGMEAAVNEVGGTARVSRFSNFRIAGKTATVQVIGHTNMSKKLEESEEIEEIYQNHAWFIAFGPVEDPQIGVTVLVEHGGAGSSGAGPIARKIFEFYINHRYHQTASTPASPFKDRLQAAFNN
ncbi:MAG: penicillin-binding protein 2 [SAR324 cluster bacterium]|nr:penicillin-binding protein 2 [SAR324 cluster bacterium]